MPELIAEDSIVQDSEGRKAASMPEITLQEQRDQHLFSALDEICEKNKRIAVFLDDSKEAAAEIDAKFECIDEPSRRLYSGRETLAFIYERHNRLARINLIMACGSCALNKLCPYRYGYDFFEAQNHYSAQRKKFAKKLKSDPGGPCFPIHSYR